MKLSNFFNLNRYDVIKGAIVAGGVALLTVLTDALSGCAFDLACYDWGNIWAVTWKATAVYLSKNFLTTEDGKVLGRIG